MKAWREGVSGNDDGTAGEVIDNSGRAMNCY